MHGGEPTISVVPGQDDLTRPLPSSASPTSRRGAPRLTEKLPGRQAPPPEPISPSPSGERARPTLGRATSRGRLTSGQNPAAAARWRAVYHKDDEKLLKAGWSQDLVQALRIRREVLFEQVKGPVNRGRLGCGVMLSYAAPSFSTVPLTLLIAVYVTAFYEVRQPSSRAGCPAQLARPGNHSPGRALARVAEARWEPCDACYVPSGGAFVRRGDGSGDRLRDRYTSDQMGAEAAFSGAGMPPVWDLPRAAILSARIAKLDWALGLVRGDVHPLLPGVDVHGDSL